MKWNNLVLLIVVVLLIIVDFLTFHDIFEPHTFKDWLILVITILTLVYSINLVSKKTK